jgi:hypothetical protein
VSDPRRALVVILALYLALGLAYSLATPVGEGPDEPGHIAYVAFLLREHRLPRHGDAGPPLEQQVKHPPLYYLALAAATAGGRYDGLEWFANPHCCNLEQPSPAVIRHPPADRIPYGPSYWTVRVARLVTLLFGLLAVLGTYAAARVAFPGRPERWVAAAGCVAFLPQFLFMQGVVNNDGLANALAALTLWAALRVALDGATRRRLVVLGTLVGLALVTKLTTLAWAGVALAAGLIAAWRARSGRVVASAALWAGLPAALIAGPWFAWNLALNGDILGWGRFEGAAAEVARKVPLEQQWPDYLAIQWGSFWGSFGWVTVRMPDWVYRFLAAVTVAALAGLALAGARWLRARRSGQANERSAWAVLVVALAGALVYASVFRLAFTFDLTVAQGRYLFTALPAFAILFSLGLLSLAPARHAARMSAAIVTGMLLLALYGLFGVLWPTFRPPPRLTPEALAAIPRRVDARLGETIRLLGYRLDAPRLTPGGTAIAELYWDTSRPVDDGYVAFAHVLDAEGRVVGRWDGLPRGGLYPPVLWYPDWPWADTIRVPIAPWAAPGRAEIQVGLYPTDRPEDRLPVRAASDGAGSAAADHVSLGPLLIRPATPPTVPPTATLRADVFGADADPGGRARLSGVRLAPGAPTADGTPISLTLYWTPLTGFDADYTVFVHALGPDGRSLAGADAPPGGGRYPTTLWSPGEVVADTHRLVLPPGVDPREVRWELGLYRPADGTRLPARRPDGGRWPDDAVAVGPLPGTAPTLINR